MSINKNYQPLSGPGKDLLPRAVTTSSKLICMIVGCKLGDPAKQFQEANWKAVSGIKRMERNAFRRIYGF